MHDGDMSVKYYPTGGMWADVIIKPLQGQAFRKMYIKLMNMPEVYIEDEAPITPSSAPKTQEYKFAQRQE